MLDWLVEFTGELNILKTSHSAASVMLISDWLKSLHVPQPNADDAKAVSNDQKNSRDIKIYKRK